MINVVPYQSSHQAVWNGFLRNAKNSSFLHERAYMEYHADRFNDASVLVFNNDELVALLPANKKTDGTVVSHSGLTFGGLILPKNIRLTDTLQVFRGVMKHWYEREVETIVLKPIPRFYETVSCDDVFYGLFLAKAELIQRNTAITIDNRNPLPYQERRKRAIKKAVKSHVAIKREVDFDGFWNNVLTPNLLSRYGVKPVHSLEEIKLLASRFPENIKQFNAFADEKLLAGVTIYETPTVAHAQYISALDEGRDNGALDLLFDTVIKAYAHKSFFDFGICNEENGLVLNKGLLEWKEGFGARTFVHDFYELKTKNFALLDAYS